MNNITTKNIKDSTNSLNYPKSKDFKGLFFIQAKYKF